VDIQQQEFNGHSMKKRSKKLAEAQKRYYEKNKKALIEYQKNYNKMNEGYNEYMRNYMAKKKR